MKTRTNPSNLSWYENEAKPNQNSLESNSSWPSVPETPVPADTRIPTKIMPEVADAIMILRLFDISERNMKKSDNGKNDAVMAFEGMDRRNETGDSGQAL